MKDIKATLGELPSFGASLKGVTVTQRFGVTAHDELTNRDLPDQHPASAITGLDAAIESALADAKASGIFDGKDGKDGYTPIKGIDYFDGAKGAKGDRGEPGEPGENGSPGARGLQGETGKSAYEYAQDGGYEGSEAEFAEKLAAEPLIGTTDEITPAEVAAAIESGRPVALTHVLGSSGNELRRTFNSFKVLRNYYKGAQTEPLVIGELLRGDKNLDVDFFYIWGNLDGKDWMFTGNSLARKSDIPSSLPNPYALTVNGTPYDGTSAVSIELKASGSDFSADEGEDGYIKNRTHYVDKNGTVHKLDNKFIDAEWMAIYNRIGNNDTVIAEQTLTSGIWSKLQTRIVPGSTYNVYVNNTLYTCVCYVHDDAGIYLGNGSLSGSSGSPNNNEPFCIYASTDSATSGFFYKTAALSYPLSLKVEGYFYEEYNKLPEGFLPECVVKSVNGKTPDESGNVSITVSGGGGGNIDVTAKVGQTIVVDEVDGNGTPLAWKAADLQERTHYAVSEPITVLNGTYQLADNIYMEQNGESIPLAVGETYTVVFDGQTYVCECKKSSFSGLSAIAIGNLYLMNQTDGYTPEPFAIAGIENVGWGIISMSNGSHTVKVTGTVDTFVQKIPEKFYENTKPLYVELFPLGDEYAISKTADEIDSAYKSGANIILKWILNEKAEMLFPLVTKHTTDEGVRKYVFYGFCTMTDDYQKIPFRETEVGGNTLVLDIDD